MLAAFNRRGGKHRLVDRTPERAAIHLEFDGTEYDFELTWEQVMQEPFVYRGGPDAQMAELNKPFEERRLKDKYRTPRSRMQMLWARLISDSVRAVDPQSNQGTYTPEEIDDFDGVEVVAEPTPAPVADVSDRINQMKSAGPAPTPATANDPEPNPFNKPVTPVADFDTCPIPGKMNGIRWDTMPIDHLSMALKLKHETMQPGHYDAISAAAKALEAKS